MLKNYQNILKTKQRKIISSKQPNLILTRNGFDIIVNPSKYISQPNQTVSTCG